MVSKIQNGQLKDKIKTKKSSEDKLGLSRRQFVAGVTTAMIGGAIGVVTANAETPTRVIIEGTAREWDEESDVVIVGAGGAGLFAAISAHDNGSKVAVLEKERTLYVSSTAICGGTITAAGSSVQKELQVKDTPDLFYQDTMKEGDYVNDEEILRTFVDNAMEVVEWFKGKGLKFILRSYPGFSVDRLHYAGTGKEYVDVLAEEIKKRELQVFFNTVVKNIIVDHSSGAVIGIEAERGRRKVLHKAKKGVVLTTGGFGGDKDVVDRFLLLFKGALVGSSPNSTGDGLLMSMKSWSAVTHLSFAAI